MNTVSKVLDLGGMMSVFNDAQRLKKVMLKKKLVAARAKCTRCDGMLWGKLVGPKQRLRMRCDGDCRAAIME